MGFLKDLWGFLEEPEKILAVAHHCDHVGAGRPDRACRQLRYCAVYLYPVLVFLPRSETGI